MLMKLQLKYPHLVYLYGFSKRYSRILTTEQKYKFVVTQILQLWCNFSFSARTSNEPFYIKIQTMLKLIFQYYPYIF